MQWLLTKNEYHNVPIVCSCILAENGKKKMFLNSLGTLSKLFFSLAIPVKWSNAFYI